MNRKSMELAINMIVRYSGSDAGEGAKREVLDTLDSLAIDRDTLREQLAAGVKLVEELTAAVEQLKAERDQLKAVVEAVRGLPTTWRSDAADHDDPEVDIDWIQVHNGCADELDAALNSKAAK